ncbi:unnamed protein product, partial [Ceratitis capitata]
TAETKDAFYESLERAYGNHAWQYEGGQKSGKKAGCLPRNHKTPAQENSPNYY